MIIVIISKLKGNGNLLGVIKIIIIAFIFAPFQIELIGYSLLLGIHELDFHSKLILVYFNFMYKPYLLIFFYFFFIPVQSFLFSQVENKGQMPFTIISFAIYPLIFFKSVFNKLYYYDDI